MRSIYFWEGDNLFHSVLDVLLKPLVGNGVGKVLLIQEGHKSQGLSGTNSNIVRFVFFYDPELG